MTAERLSTAPLTTAPLKTVVIGAGLAGLAAALHLRGAGHEVTVLERELWPGGRCGRLEQDGFTFDTGPTVFTMPGLLDEAFRAVGSSFRDYVELGILDPGYRATFADGSALRVRYGHEAMRAEIAEHSGAKDAAAFDRFVRWLRALNDVEVPNFIDVNFDSPLDLLRRPAAAAKLLGLGGFGRLGPAIERRFEDERLHRIFSFQAMYAGLAPADALALYAVITYMDSIEGVWFPEGGMRAVPDAMARAAEEAGVEIRYGANVAEIVHDGVGGRARGARLDDGELVAGDAVVCTLDLPVAYGRLLPQLRAPRAVRRASYSPSCVVWHLGVRGEIPAEAAHHNIAFGEAWDDAFVDLLDRGIPMRDPSRFIAIPSLDDPGAAPEGCHTLYVLEPAPNLLVGRVDWQEETPRLRERMLADLTREGCPLEILTEAVMTPEDWRAQGMAAGTPFAVSHAFRHTGPFRPSNVDARVPGLVFAGSSTTPGVGIPMVLISGKLAAQRVAELAR